MTNSAIAGNSATRGGGINNTALVRMTNSTVSGNSAHSGGGIENDRVLEMTNSGLSQETLQRLAAVAFTTSAFLPLLRSQVR